MATPRICSVDHCGKSARARGWCVAHYERWKRHGDPLGGRTPDGEPLRYLREVVLPYDGPDCLAWPYNRVSGGYGMVGGKYVHRMVCEHVNGPPPTPRHEAAHNCGKGHLGCVAKSHLEWKTPAENQADRILHGTQSRRARS